MTARVGPHLIRPGDASSATPATPAPAGRRNAGWLLPLALAAALVAVMAWTIETHRVHDLEARVGVLTDSLRAAEAEVAARRSHLDAIRSSVADVRERVGALESLAGADPTAPFGKPDH